MADTNFLPKITFFIKSSELNLQSLPFWFDWVIVAVDHSKNTFVFFGTP
jgi:hypothetical protein